MLKFSYAMTSMLCYVMFCYVMLVQSFFLCSSVGSSFDSLMAVSGDGQSYPGNGGPRTRSTKGQTVT